MTLYLGNNLISGTQTLVGESRNIGQIIPSAIPLTDAGLHLLDGTLILGNGIYSAFVDYIAGLVSDYPDLFVTETEWQTSVNTYGVCGKFVYDSVNNTVRLPKVTGILEGTTDVTALGDLVEQFVRLPNITGTFAPYIGGDHSGIAWDNTSYQLSGAFYRTSIGKGKTSTETDGSYGRAGLGLDASLSSSVYSGDGTNTVIQPQAIKCYYYIVIATSTKTDIQVDIDEIATDLNGKADVDLSNCTKPHVVETYVNGTSWYRVYSDGWCQQGGFCTGSTSYTVTFLKPFINTNYNPTVTFNYSHSGNIMNMGCDTLTTTTMRININDGNQGSNRPVFWQACGYIR